MNTFNQQIYCDKQYWERPTLSYCRLNWIQTPTPVSQDRQTVRATQREERQREK
jgi:hypothetical protein